MHVLKTLSAAALALVAMVAIGTATPAQAQEPHYIIALHQLRGARDYIVYDQRPGFDQLRHHAKEEIEKAINDIKLAAWDDGKGTDFNSGGANGPGWAPMHDAKRYLDQARANVAQGVDTAANVGLRERALAHIDEAERAVDRIIEISNSRQ